jgi:hypothetical protein
VAFNKEPDPSIIAQCVSGVGCFGTDQYNISQPKFPAYNKLGNSPTDNINDVSPSFPVN